MQLPKVTQQNVLQGGLVLGMVTPKTANQTLYSLQKLSYISVFLISCVSLSDLDFSPLKVQTMGLTLLVEILHMYVRFGPPCFDTKFGDPLNNKPAFGNPTLVTLLVTTLLLGRKPVCVNSLSPLP